MNEWCAFKNNPQSEEISKNQQMACIDDMLLVIFKPNTSSDLINRGWGKSLNCPIFPYKSHPCSGLLSSHT